MLCCCKYLLAAQGRRGHRGRQEVRHVQADAGLSQRKQSVHTEHVDPAPRPLLTPGSPVMRPVWSRPSDAVPPLPPPVGNCQVSPADRVIGAEFMPDGKCRSASTTRGRALPSPQAAPLSSQAPLLTTACIGSLSTGSRTFRSSPRSSRTRRCTGPRRRCATRCTAQPCRCCRSGRLS